MELLCRDTLSRGFEILELTPSEASPPCPADLMVDMKPLDRWKSWKISRVTGSSVVPVGEGRAAVRDRYGMYVGEAKA